MATINYERLQGKLNILADAAKYDVSCSSSAGTRKNQGGGLGKLTLATLDFFFYLFFERLSRTGVTYK